MPPKFEMGNLAAGAGDILRSRIRARSESCVPKRDGGLVLRPGNGLVGEYRTFKFFLRFDEKILDTVATLVGHGNFVGQKWPVS